MEQERRPRDPDERLAEMARVNRAQEAFYSGERSSGTLGGVWRSVRRRLDRLRSTLGIKEEIYDLHRAWLGDLAGKRVLDLGCYSGNALSLELAESSGSYLGIDLAAAAIETLRARLAHVDSARVEAMDFLELPAGERFDVIYAYSVLHHFRHLGAALDRVERHLEPGGLLVTYDPLETSLPIWAARRVYRPFQPDSAWEWPFGRAAVRQLTGRFEPVGIRGVLGRAKWALPLSVMAPRAAASLGRRWNASDRASAVRPGRRLWTCLHLTMCLRRPARPETSSSDCL